MEQRVEYVKRQKGAGVAMKVTLDLTALVANGKLTQAEADRLKGLAAADTGSLGTNIFLAFGTVAVALGAGTLLPTPQTAIIVGALLVALGLALTIANVTRWALFAQIVTVIGALGVVGGVWLLSDGSWAINLAMAVGLGTAALAARSGLLAALAVLMLAVALGSGTAYWNASYFLGVERPALTIGVLSALTLALFLGSLRMPPAYERLAIIAARTAILMINAAFLIGSLFGDDLVHLPSVAFSIAWAVVLIVVGGWAIMANRRWVVNAAAVFGAIHFYTQWFETLGPSPGSILGGGVLLIAFGLALAWFNKWVGARRDSAAGAR
jgi:iron complex transport system permease protein